MKRLSRAQREWLQRLARGPQSRPYGDSFRVFDRVMEALVNLGFAIAREDREYQITDAGREALRREFSGVHVIEVCRFGQHVCRFCGVTEYQYAVMMKYGTRAYAHPGCYVERVGIDALPFLPTHTIARMPASAFHSLRDVRLAMEIYRAAKVAEAIRDDEARS